MSKFLTQEGKLSPDAKSFVKEYFEDSIDGVLAIAESEQELQIIGSILCNILGNKVSIKLVDIKNEQK